LSLNLNDVVTDGSAKFKVVKQATSLDVENAKTLINAKMDRSDNIDAATINGFTVNSDVPADAVFTDTTYDIVTNSAPGLVPQPNIGDQEKFLCSDGTWKYLPTIVTLRIPSQSNTLTYTGNVLTPTWNDYNENGYTITGDTSAIDADTYTVTFSLNEGYRWEDDTDADKNINWNIKKAKINTLPSQNGSLTYNGNNQTPSWIDYDSNKLTIGGVYENQIDADTYTATFTPTSNYMWNDNSIDSKNVTWTINRQNLTSEQSTFSQSGTLTYNENAQSPTISGYDSTYHTITGNSQTDAGSYTAIISLNKNYAWYDSTTSNKEVSWSIEKAPCSISFNPNSVSLDSSNLSTNVTITRSGDGAITASTSDSSIATVSISDTTLMITAKATGSCTITVNVGTSADGNYSSNSKTLSVTCTLSKALANCSPSDIKSIVDSGTASTNWSVGDTTATITLNGNVSDGLTLNNYQCKAILIGLDHNKAKETGSKSSAHFILGKDTSNNEIAFCDVYDYTKTSGTWFNHNNSSSSRPYGSTSGGWKSSNLRTNIMPKFKNTLPSAWQNILGTVTKYTDNTGGGSNTASYVTATSDQLFLLAEWEVFGKRSLANSAEQNNQQQYTYFANGNGKVRKNHQSTSSSVFWWLRSVFADSTSNFVYASTSGSANNSAAHNAYGVVPGFAIVQS